MNNSIYTNTATTPNTALALANAAREFRTVEDSKLRDIKILNAMKINRNTARLAHIRAQYRATVANMQAAYDQAYA